MMDTSLTNYIKTGTIISRGEAVWGNGIRLEITGYTGTEPPPVLYVTSVRCVIFRNNEVLVVRGPNGYHVMPGGRIEKGETHEEALRREIREESGWTLDKPEIMGFWHLHHTSNKPADYAYPYPDFLWLIYISEAGKYRPKTMKQGDFELEVKFYAIEKAEQLPMENGQMELLKAAVKTRKNIIPGITK